MIYLLLAVVFTPEISLGFGPAFRLEDPLLLSIFFYRCLMANNKIDFSKLELFILFIIFLFSVVWACSVFNGLFQGWTAGFQDLNQIIRFVKYSLVIYLVSSSSSRSFEEWMQFRKSITWISVGALALGIIQWFNPLGVNSYYISYVSNVHAFTLLDGYPYPRAIGMVGNPNAFGLALFMLGLSLYVFWYGGKNKIFVLFFVTLFLMLSSAITMSRSVLGISLIFVLFMLLRFSLFFTLCLLTFFTLISSYLNFAIAESVFFRLLAVLDPLSDGSLLTRFDNWRESLDIIVRNEFPIFGIGPTRLESFITVDNEWIYIWRLYGVVGVILLLLLVYCPFFFAKRLELNFIYLVFGFCLTLYCFVAPFFYHNTVFPLYIFLITVLARYKEKVDAHSSRCA
ncbi:hypothetical protein [Marinobacter lipolyticus]|uniref:hypothetical protein n=1 Tax=Marinobacter lipolyticus TaxID=209639 RepID=UPI001BD0E789|nr:hypothetical protein [Marinobacter lipolyticus]